LVAGPFGKLVSRGKRVYKICVRFWITIKRSNGGRM